MEQQLLWSKNVVSVSHLFTSWQIKCETDGNCVLGGCHTWLCYYQAKVRLVCVLPKVDTHTVEATVVEIQWAKKIICIERWLCIHFFKWKYFLTILIAYILIVTSFQENQLSLACFIIRISKSTTVRQDKLQIFVELLLAWAEPDNWRNRCISIRILKWTNWSIFHDCNLDFMVSHYSSFRDNQLEIIINGLILIDSILIKLRI